MRRCTEPGPRTARRGPDRSHAQASCKAGAKGLAPAFGGTSNIVSLTIDGKTASTTGSISLNGGLLAVKVGVTSTSGAEVVQRALEVDLNGVPVLVAAEARAGVKDAPCSAS